MPKASRNNRQHARDRKLAEGLTTRVLRLRVKDKHASLLLSQARLVNFVWNFDNETSHKVLKREGRFVSSDELHKFTTGATKEGLDLHSQTVQAVNEQFVTRRRQFKRAKPGGSLTGAARSTAWAGYLSRRAPSPIATASCSTAAAGTST